MTPALRDLTEPISGLGGGNGSYEGRETNYYSVYHQHGVVIFRLDRTETKQVKA